VELNAWLGSNSSERPSVLVVLPKPSSKHLNFPILVITQKGRLAFLLLKHGNLQQVLAYCNVAAPRDGLAIDIFSLLKEAHCFPSAGPSDMALACQVSGVSIRQGFNAG